MRPVVKALHCVEAFTKGSNEMTSRRATMCLVLILGIAGPPLRAQAAPNCANMFAQMGGAAAGLYAQSRQMIDVCNDKGWTSGPCLAQIAVVAQASVWMWWTSSNYYCQCRPNPNADYCTALGLLPAPPKPAGGGGGLAPVGPPPPKPLAQVDIPDPIIRTE
jgi:hypothetical protein